MRAHRPPLLSSLCVNLFFWVLSGSPRVPRQAGRKPGGSPLDKGKVHGPGLSPQHSSLVRNPCPGDMVKFAYWKSCSSPTPPGHTLTSPLISSGSYTDHYIQSALAGMVRCPAPHNCKFIRRPCDLYLSLVRGSHLAFFVIAVYEKTD